MSKHITLKLAAAAVALSFSHAATAAVVVGPTSGTYSTFTDTITNRQWVKLDTFFNRSASSMFNEVTAAGFTVGTRADVDQLLSTLPLLGGNWSTYATIMGRAPNRDLIWGAYGPVDGNGNIGWAYASNGDNSWISVDSTFSATSIPNGGSEVADMNVWAFRSDGVGAVPEPATWMMMLMGFGLIGAAMRSNVKSGLRVRYT